jgi:hypothetical protein
MATVGITIGRAVDGFKPAYAGVPVISEVITSSGTSQQTTGTVPQVPDVAARVTVSGGSVWVKTGSANPTAAAGDDYLVPDGGTMDLVFLEVGWKIAVVDA